MVAAAMRTIFAQPNPTSVRHQLDVIAAMLGAVPQSRGHASRRRTRADRVRGLPRRALEKDLVHQPARTGQQRDQTPHRRRRVFPNPPSLLRLVSAVLAEIHDEWQASDRRYLSEASMAKLLDPPTIEQPTLQPVAAPTQIAS